MDYLINYAEEYGLRNIIEYTSEHEAVQGVIVDINPLWLIAWIVKNTKTSPNQSSKWWERLLKLYRFYGYDYGFQGVFNIPWVSIDETEITNSMIIDLDWTPPQWKEEFGNQPPVIVKVCLKPDSDSPELNYSEFSLPILIETRPIARLASNPKNKFRPLIGGTSCGSGNYLAGTLGGILEDNNQNKYGISCSHVFSSVGNIDQPALKDNISAKNIGDIVFQDQLKHTNTNIPCNPYIGNNKLNEYDVALIKLKESINSNFEILNIGKVDGILPNNSICPSLTVETSGRTTGHSYLKVGGIAVTYEFVDPNGHTYCFKNLFEVRQSTRLRQMLRRPIREGDSGAWVCAQGSSGTEWCGMIMGEDRVQGYAILAENITDHLQQEGYDLHCS